MYKKNSILLNGWEKSFKIFTVIHITQKINVKILFPYDYIVHVCNRKMFDF